MSNSRIAAIGWGACMCFFIGLGAFLGMPTSAKDVLIEIQFCTFTAAIAVAVCGDRKP